MYVIAEVGQAHDGSLGILHSYIDAVAETGVDAIKFQIHIPEAESSIYEPFRINFSYQDKTRYEYWRRMSFTPEQWGEIKKHCESVGLEFIASPFSQEAVGLLEELEVKRYKIGSGEVNNFLMLRKVCETGKPIILSSGMSSYHELDRAVQFIQERSNKLSILQCTTSYPTPPEKLGLNVIGEMRERYPGISIGLSDHTGTIYAGLAAAALEAEILEFHVVFDRRMFGPDSKSSLTIDETKQLVKGIKFLKEAQEHAVDKSSNKAFGDLKNIFEKSLAVNRDLKQGHMLTFDDLEAKKPKGLGIASDLFESVIGKKLRHDMHKFAFLNFKDLEG